MCKKTFSLFQCCRGENTAVSLAFSGPGVANELSLEVGTIVTLSFKKVAASIPDGVIEIFHWHNPSGRTMALGLTQPLTEMSTRNISWVVKAEGAWDWQPYHLHDPIVLKSGSLNLLEPSGPVQACNRIALPLPLPQKYVEDFGFLECDFLFIGISTFRRRLLSPASPWRLKAAMPFNIPEDSKLIHKVYLKAWTKFRSGCFSSRQRKIIVHIFPQTLIIWYAAPTFARPQSFRFLSLETIKNPSPFSSN